MVTGMRFLILLLISYTVLGQDPCHLGSEPEEPEEPNPAEEPDDSGCYDDNSQWLPGMWLIPSKARK